MMPRFQERVLQVIEDLRIEVEFTNIEKIENLKEIVQIQKDALEKTFQFIHLSHMPACGWKHLPQLEELNELLNNQDEDWFDPFP